jgi:arginase
MDRPIVLVGATSSIGIRPYDDGQVRQLNTSPSVLRERGLAHRLGAIDLGDVGPPLYRDYVRPPNRARNEEEVVVYSRSLAERVAAGAAYGRFVVVLGGDCSIVLGCLLGARRAAAGRIGLAYVDAHADFATPEESRTGSVSSMCLALAVGRGKSPLARLAGRSPLVDGCDVALLGRRDTGMGWHGHGALSAFNVLDMPDSQLFTNDVDELTSVALARVAATGVTGFWIQIDADVLNPAVMSAVDSPEPGGPMPGELVSLLRPLVQHPLALGLSLTIYDPALDADRSCARRLVSLLEGLLAPVKHERDCAARN